MAATNPGQNSRITPLMIGAILGLGLVIIFFFNLRGGDESTAVEPHPWRVLTVNNSAVIRNNLPIRIICPLPPEASVASQSTGDCYLRASMQYNPVEEMASDSDCQLASGFVLLVVGIGEEAKAVDSQSVDLFDEDGSCSLHPGVVDDIVFWFESVPQTEKLSLVRFIGIDPQLELAENLEFIVE